MHILQIGLPKSGNFWLYTILKKCLQAAQVEHRSFIQQQPIHRLAQSWEMSVRKQIDIDFLDITDNALFYRLGNIFRYPVDDLAAYVQASTLVWSHSPHGLQTSAVLSPFDKVIYILRDPRDVAVSWANFVFTPYMRRYYPWHTAKVGTVQDYLQQNLGPILQDWCHHVGGYLTALYQQDIYCVFYERLVADLATELMQLLDYLELDLEAQQQADIIESVAFQAMQKDNPKHLRQGGMSQWQGCFEVEQMTTVMSQVVPLLQYLNYGDQSHAAQLPQLPPFAPGPDLALKGTMQLLTPAPH